MIADKRLWAAVAAAGVAVGGWFWQKGKRQEEPRFRTVKAQRGSLDVTVLATGVVQPQNRVQIKPPIAGRAERIMVREGQTVRKGAVLAWMSSNERAALLDAARAKGPEELAHWEELYKAAPLVAPLDGLIIARAVEPGQAVSASDAVLVMSNRLIVKAQVDETDIGRVRVGLPVEVVLDAYPGEKTAARVDHIAYEAKTVNNVTIYEVDIVPEAVPEFMRSGMTASVTFLVSRKRDALFLPAEAVHRDGGRPTVLLPGPDGSSPQPREVELGISDGKRVEVVSGLSEGDGVLVRSFRLPRASSAVNPFSPGGRPKNRSEGSAEQRRSRRGDGS